MEKEKNRDEELRIFQFIGKAQRTKNRNLEEILIYEKRDKQINLYFYIASVLFFIASAIGFTSGNESSMAIVWLCLGSSFLCLGSTHKKKETIQMINNFLLVLLENRDLSSPFCDLQLLVDRFIA